MGNEAAHIRGWIAYELLSNVRVKKIVCDDIYPGIAPRDAGDKRIIFSYVSDATLYKLGRRRSKVVSLYDIKAYCECNCTSELKILADEIDKMFAGFTNRVWQGWCFSSQFEQLIDSVETEEPFVKRWNILGATYKISAYEINKGIG